jgi:hypothetical protein
MSARGETPRARRIWVVSIVFLIGAAILGLSGLCSLAAGFTYGYQPIDAAALETGGDLLWYSSTRRRDDYRVAGELRDGRAVVSRRGNVDWVYAPLVAAGRGADDRPVRLYYAAPMARYMRTRNDASFCGRLSPGVRADALFADRGHPVPPHSYTLTDIRPREAYLDLGESLLMIALALALPAIAGIWYVGRERESANV